MADRWNESPAPARIWEAGEWSVDIRGAELADISVRGRSILRSIRAIVRDRDWNTAGWIVEEIAEYADAVTISVRSEGLESDLRGELRIVAAGDQLTVTLDAVSHVAFDTARTGLVVLHPPALAGTELAVTHPGGSLTQTVFPEAISPHQPAFDIAGLAWRHEGTDVALRFDGDVFEMEDQRNWTDASFKTYSRPLRLPTPYRLAAGDRVRQSLTITAKAVRGTEAEFPTIPADEGGSARTTTRIVLADSGPFPEISVGASTAVGERPAIDPVGSTLLVELDLAKPGWRRAIERAARTGLPLDVRLVPDPDTTGSLEQAAAALAGVVLARVGAFAATGPAAHVSDAATVDALRVALAKAGIDAPIIGGVRSHFTELNREHERLPGGLAGVTFSTTPLFHSLDTAQLIEAIAMQRLVARQAVEIASGTPVHIGPVTLRPRFNNVATSDAEPIDASDPRQSSPALAAWAVASAAALAVPGVASISFFEEWGPRGIRTATGEPLPAARAIEALSSLADAAGHQQEAARLLNGDSPDGLIWAIGATTSGATRVLVVNLDVHDRLVRIEQPSGVYEEVVPALAFNEC